MKEIKVYFCVPHQTESRHPAPTFVTNCEPYQIKRCQDSFQVLALRIPSSAPYKQTVLGAQDQLHRAYWLNCSKFKIVLQHLRTYLLVSLKHN